MIRNIIRETMPRKVIASFLLISLINQIAAPTVAWALTSGPTAPEATSFEPVDTTDMVNLASGDLAYNIPLMEVPGPEGGYPLSLSYHAGIQPNEDASWVGLGWSLNPGAINRSVNGYPDDWYGSESSRRDFWEGGTSTASRIGINVPLPGNVGNMSAGLSFSNDTYLGRGMGWDLSVVLAVPNTPLSAGIGIGMSTDGRFQLSEQIGADIGSFSIGVGANNSGEVSVFGGVSMGPKGKDTGYGLSLSASTNFSSISAGFGITKRSESVGTESGKGTSYSTRSVGGIGASTQNSRAGSLSTKESSFSVNLLLASYSRSKVRYWSNEKEESFMYGALYPGWMMYIDIPDEVAYDAYALHEEGKNIVDYAEPNKEMGGAYPSYDLYHVSAQGLGGTMRPYRFEGEALQQNRWEKTGDNTITQTIKYIANSSATADPEFRFENDFSNNYLQNYPDFPTLGSELIFYDPPNSGPLYDDPEWMNGASGNKLAGTRHISYFVTKVDGTVAPLGNEKFIAPVVNGGLNRRAHISQAQSATHIAGFAITNESGVTYHYNLPAYSYNEEMYQERKDRSKGLMFNRQVRSQGYAYTWYLTAITGPDYVDRGTLGVVDNQDYGQWISFEYGKWSDSYNWRNPSEGYHHDDDNEFRTVSMGKREVYYLNFIRTRSHVAMFEKDVRRDAKGSSPEIFNKNWAGSPINTNTDYTNEGIYNTNSSQSLRLDRIYLMNSSQASNYTGGGSAYIPSGRSIPCSSCELYGGVLDKFDIDAIGRSTTEANAIRVIDFIYDYSLARGTTNSYDISNPSVKYGKLTLKSLKFRGAGGQSLLPPIDFEYNYDAFDLKRVMATISNALLSTSDGSLEPGDMIESDDANAYYYGVITQKIQNGTQWQYSLKGGQYSSSQGAFRTTKNPPYHKDRHDLWGMYKSDFSFNSDQNISRFTTPTSNKGTDAWSLRKIKTGLGADIKIEYEGDTYSKSVLNRTRCLTFNNFYSQGSNNFYMNVYTVSGELQDLFKVGDEIDIVMLKERPGNNFSVINSSSYLIRPKVTAINGHYLHINCPSAMTADILYNAGGGSGTIKTGNIGPTGTAKYYGGGIRVKAITVDNLSGTKTTTRYSYNKPNSLLSSGVTSYEPIGLDTDRVAQLVSSSDQNVQATASKIYRRVLYSEMSRLYGISREVPAPGVIYEHVTVSSEVFNSVDNQTREVPGSVSYQFEVFRENMVGKLDATPRRTAVREAGYSSYYTRNLVLKKFVNNIGQLKRVIYYDKDKAKLKESINHFLHDGLENETFANFMNAYEQRLVQYKKQGLIKERYSEVKSVWTGSGAHWHVKATLSGREEFPTIKTGQTVIDYITGVRNSSVDLAFDFYSGAVTKRLITDVYGNRFLQEVVPAYRKYPEMGLKIQNATNKNMLTQETASYLYKLGTGDDKQGLVSASVQTWDVETPVLDGSGNVISQNSHSGNGRIWRKSASYSWMPLGQTASGFTPVNNFTDFNWQNSVQSAFWRKTDEVKKYDIFSKPLESMDFNGFYSAQKMGYSNSKVIVSGNNASYHEIATAGFEDGTISAGKLSSNITLVTGTIAGVSSHTGGKSLIVESNRTGISYDLPLSYLPALGRDYLASIWVSSTSGDVSSARFYYSVGSQTVYATLDPQKKARGWYLLQLKIPGSALTNAANTLTVRCANVNGSGPLFFDDFRFQPLQSDVQSYVYNIQSGDLTYILDNNNLFTRFEYDSAGRLTKVYKEVLGKSITPLVKETSYYYKKAQ